MLVFVGHVHTFDEIFGSFLSFQTNEFLCSITKAILLTWSQSPPHLQLFLGNQPSGFCWIRTVKKCETIVFNHILFLGKKPLRTPYIFYFSKKFYLIGFTWQPLGQKSCPEQVQYAPALFLGRAESSKSVSGLEQTHTSGGSWRERHTPNNPFSGHEWKKIV